MTIFWTSNQGIEYVLQWSHEPIQEWIGVLLITPNGYHVPLVVKLNFEATNNMAEYEACITRIEALRELEVKEAEVFGDSTLVIA